MTTKLFNSDWQPKRPFRALGITFAVLALLFCIATPFTDSQIRWLFFFWGLAYSAIIAFLTTGLALLPRPMVRRIVIASLTVQVFAVILMAAMFYIAHFYLPFSLIMNLVGLIPWVVCPSGAAMIGFACYGWYLHLTHDATKAA